MLGNSAKLLLLVVLFAGFAFSAAPVAENVTLNSSLGTNYTNENLTLYYDSYDADSDAIANITNWFLNGNSISLLFLPFEGGSNSTYTKDYSNNSNEAETINATWGSTSGYDGFGAYDFDGESSYMNVSMPHVGEEATFSLWLYARNWEHEGVVALLTRRPAGSVYEFFLFFLNSTQSVTFDWGGSADRWTTGYTPPTEEWVHIAATRNSSGRALYVNGELFNSTSVAGSTTTTDQNVIIGRNSATVAYHFDGLMDDIRIYNRSLSAGQILAIYNNRTDLMVSDETSTGDTWYACITPNDGTEDGNEACSDSIGILGNSAPRVENATLNSSSGTNLTSENLTLYYDSYDANGDAISNITNWFVDGVSITLLNMPFEEGSNSTYTKDYSNYSNDGTVVNATYNSTGGYDGWGTYEFDGTSSEINAGALDITGNTELSLSVRFKPAQADNDTYGRIISINHSGEDDIRIYWRQDVLHCDFDDGTVDTTSTALTGYGSWHLVTCVYDGSTLDLYLDGEYKSQDSSVSFDFAGADGTTRIGRYLNTYFNGTIDEVAIYNRSLSAAQVLALYNNRTDLIVSDETSAGDTWYACITPNDGTVEGNENCSNTLEVLPGPTAPVTENVTLNSSSETNYTSENLTLYYDSYDVNNDAITNITNWFVDGTSVTVLHMPFEGGSNSTYTKDYSNNSNDGTVINATWTSEGAVGSAYEFNHDSHDYVNITSSSDFNFADGDFTISMWVNPTWDSNWMPLIVKREAHNSKNDWGLWKNVTGNNFDFIYGNNLHLGFTTNTTDAPSGLWTLLTLVRDGTDLKLYVNGTLDDTQALSATLSYNSDIPVKIGAGNHPTIYTYTYNGLMDEVLILKRALSAEQIQLLYGKRMDIISSSETNAGDIWYACITPNDGTEDGTEACSNTLEVLPEPTYGPLTENVTLNSSSGTNLTTENLTLYYDSYDANNDAIANITNWFLDGTSITVLNMPFEGGSNSTYAKDYSNYSNDANVSGATWNATGGYDGYGAYEFDGIDDEIVLAPDPTFDSNTEGTYSAWVYSRGTGDGSFYRSAIILQRNEDDDLVWFGSGSGNTFLFGFKFNGSQELAGGAIIIETGRWYFLAGTYNTTHFCAYVDGELDSCVDRTLDRLNGSNVTMSASTNYFRKFNGTIDNPMIFNRSLSAEQIFALYDNRTDLVVSEETSAGDIWYACITPNDGTEDGTEACSNTLEVLPEPTPPAVENVTLNSSSGTNLTTENLTLYYDSYDVNDDAIANITNWFVDGTSITLLNMPFEGGSNSTYTKDYSNNSNDGTVVNATWNATGGYDGFGAYEFDGSGDYISHSTLLDNFPSQITFSFWAKINEGASKSLFYKENVDNEDRLYAVINSTGHFTLDFEENNNGYNSQGTAQNISPGVWTHLAVTWDGTNGMTFYLNGVESANYPSKTSLIGDGSYGDLSFGRSGFHGASYLNGSMDNVMIFNRALSAEQILALYNNRTDLIAAQETSVGETWYACITPNDGTEDGTEACSNTLEVLSGNIAPLTENVTLNSSSGTDHTNENLTLFYDSLDANNDAIKNITNWFLDGTSITLLNMPFELDMDYVFYDAFSTDTTGDYEWTTVDNNLPTNSHDWVQENNWLDINIGDNDQESMARSISLPSNGYARVKFYKREDYPWDNSNGLYIRQSNDTYYQFTFAGAIYTQGVFKVVNGNTTDSLTSAGTVELNDTQYVVEMWWNSTNMRMDINGTTVFDLETANDTTEISPTSFTLYNYQIDMDLQLIAIKDMDSSNYSDVQDYSNNSNGATVEGATWNATGGYDGFGAYEFDGIDDFVDIGQFNITENLSISLWVYEADSDANAGLLYSSSEGDSTNDWGLRYTTPGTLIFRDNHDGNDDFISTGINISSGVWTHIVLAVEDSTLYPYKNGQGYGSIALTDHISRTLNDLRIGQLGGYLETNYHFNGTIDELTIYNRALSEEQVLALYNNRTDLIASSETSVGDAWYACITPSDGTEDGNETCSDTLEVLATADLWINETLNFSDSGPRQNDTVEINATIHSDLTQNHTGVNVSLYVNSAYSSSAILNVTDGYALASFNWTAEPGNNSILVSVDSNNSIDEYNETNNNASAYLFVTKVAVLEYVSPLNATEIMRGLTDSVPEDPESYVPDYTTLRARVYNYYNSSEGLSANCTFYFNGSYLGTNETDSNGNCTYSFDHTGYSQGSKELIANFTGLNYTAVAHTSDTESNTTLIIAVYQSENEELNDRSPSHYLIGDAAVLEFNVTKDGELYDPANITVEARKDSPNSVIARHTYPGDIVRTGTGEYYSKTIVNSSFPTTGAIHWNVFIDDNQTINGTAYGAIPAASGSHSDIEINAATATLNFTATGAGETVLEGTSIAVYDRNLYELETETLNSSNTYLERPGAENDTYALNYTTSNGTSLLLRGANATEDFRVSAQFIEQYSGDNPSGAINLSGAVALNTSTFNFSNATISIPLEGLPRVDYIYHCTEWDFDSGTCNSWQENATSDYPDYSINSTHFSFTVYSFTGYAGGVGYNANLTIYDEYEGTSAEQDTTITFYANYTNSTSGAHVSGAECNITFDDGNSSAMEDNGQNYNYTKSGGFESPGIHYWNVSCGGTSYDALNASDNVTVYSPLFSNVQMFALDGNRSIMGGESAFNFSNLQLIEYLMVNFTMIDSDGIDNMGGYFTANGTNGCSLGNNQSSMCYNYSDGNWIEFKNGTDSSTFISTGNAGDRINCTYNGTSTHRDYTCEIDEHYNPNVWKHYPLNFSDVKWQSGASERIKASNIWKVDLDANIVPLDADYYKLDFRVNYTGSPSQPLFAFLCNSTYSTGKPSDSPYCSLVASKLPSQLQDDGTKFRAIFTKNLTEQLGDIGYVLLTSDAVGGNYYALKSYGFLGEGSVLSYISNNNGNTYNILSDGYESELNINWFYNGTNSDVTQMVFRIWMNDTLGQEENSTEYVMEWQAYELNKPPIVDLITPEIGANASSSLEVTWYSADPNGDAFNTTLSASNGTEYILIASGLPQSTTAYEWDLENVSSGAWNLTAQSCENETAELYCGNNTKLFNVRALPVAENVTLNSSLGTNYSSENLTLHYDSYDADGDPVKNLTNWYVDGEPIAVLNMPFEGGSNSTYTEDYSNYSNDGTVSGATYNPTGGYDGWGAYEFDGENDYIEIPDDGSLDITSDISLEAWTKSDGCSDSGLVAKWQGAGGQKSYMFRCASNDMTFCLNNGSSNFCVSADGTFTDGNWHHFIGTWDGTTIRLYMDGELQADTESFSQSIYSGNAPLWIGAYYSTSYLFNGSIDDVVVYNRSLSAEQILALYNNRTDLIVSEETSVGDTWYACVTPNDGTEDGTEVCSNGLEILDNQNPSLSVTSPSNTTYNSSVVSLNYTVSDDSGLDSCWFILDSESANTSISDCSNGTVSGLSDGAHNVTVYANDTSSNTNSSTVYFSVDTTAPGVSITSPANTSYATNNLTVNYTTDGVSCSMFLDGTFNESLPSCENTTLSNLTDGQHYVTIYANDSVNNMGSDEIYFIVDTTAPAVALSSPANTSYATNNLTVNYTTDGVSCSMFLDGTFNESLPSCENTTLSNLTDGQHYVTIYANDSLNNTGSDEVYFTVDTGVPTVSISSPANTTYATNNLTVNYTTDGVSCSMFLDGSFNETLSGCGNTTLSNLTDGQHYITIYANDSVNNTGSGEVYFVVDTTAPGVSITSPANITYVTNNLTVNYTTDGLSCSMYLDGSFNESLSGCENTTLINLSDGQHYVTIYANDSANNTGSDEIYFIVDTTAPSVLISSPANTSYATNNLTINYTTDGVSCSLYLDGEFNESLSSCENTTLGNLTDGQHYVTIYANDSVNNTGSDEVYFTVDTTAPIVSISSPANTTYATNNLTVNYTTDGVSCSMFLDGSFNESLSSCENTTLSNLTEGQHYVTIYANDSVNNTGSDEVYFTVDTTSPTVTLTSPANISYATNNFTVNYTTDGVSCSMFLDGSFNTSLPSCENTTLSNLTDGQHYVTVYANDSVNNTGSDEVYFIVDTGAPTVSISSPANTTYATNNLTVNYTTDGVSCSMFLDGSFNESLSSCENTTLSNLTEGQHYVTIYANDSVNNTGSDEIYFTVDTGAPAVSIASPANTTYATNNLTVNYTTDGASCALLLDGTINQSLSSCENTTLSNLTDGQHYITVYANDSVNNTGSDEIYFIVDTTAPSVSVTSPANTTYATNNLTINYTTNGVSCSLYLDGEFNESLSSCENTTLGNLTDGQHYVTIYANDSVNNTGSDEVYFSVDTGVPTVSISSPANTTYATNNLTVNYTTDGVSCSLFLDGSFNISLSSCENTTLSNLTDGQHYVTIYANDSVNNTGSDEVYFIVDTSAPTVSISSPANTTYATNNLTVNYTTDGVSCSMYLDGSFNESLSSCENTTLSNLTDGQHYVTIYANDSVNNTGSDEIYFIVDTTAPSVSVTSPANTTYATNNLTINYTTNGVSCSLFLDGAINQSLTSCENTTLSNLTDGQHYITVYANDSVNNTGSDELYFTVDTTVPTVALSSPANTTYATDNITVNYTTDGVSCSMFLDGTFNTSLGSCENTTLSNLTEGQHYVTIYANDSVNNTGSGEVYFIVDTTAPSVSLTSPANTTYATNNLTVNYTTDGVSCALFLDGNFNTSLSSCENTTLSNLTDGQHYVTIHANDSVNNTGSDEAYFIIDTGAPTVSVSSPANTTYATNNLTLNYTTDGVSCALFLDGTLNQSLSSCENATLSNLTDGQHYVTIYANDSVNNTGSEEIYFTIDTTAPTVSISSPANTTYATTNITINYTTGGTTCAIFLDGTFNATLSSCENTTLTGLSETQHYITVYANDSVNNTGSDEVYFTINLNAPTVSITSPANTTYATNNLTVNYTTDGISCALFLDGAINESLTSCENTTLSNLTDGQHYVTIYANNSMNTTGSETVYFIVDTTGPTVTITSPANTTYAGTSVTLSYSTSDISSVESCWLYINGTFNTTLPGCSGTTISGLQYGQHNFTVYANDSLNNTGSSTVHFTLTEAAPPQDSGGSEPDYECFTSSDCGECEVCSGHECTLREGACAKDSDCSGTGYPFYECTDCACEGYGCFTDAYCDAGEVCGSNSLCVPSACNNDSDCAEGYSCVNQTCVAPECFTDADCAEGQLCSNHSCILWQCLSDEDCGEGESCRNGACLLPECTEDADCMGQGEGYSCTDYSCIAPECTGDEDCGENRECVSYVCEDKDEPPVEGEPQEGPEEGGETQPPEGLPPQEAGPGGEIPAPGVLDVLTSLFGSPQEAAGSEGGSPEQGVLSQARAALPLLLLLAALALIYLTWKKRKKVDGKKPWKWKEGKEPGKN